VPQTTFEIENQVYVEHARYGTIFGEPTDEKLSIGVEFPEQEYLVVLSKPGYTDKKVRMAFSGRVFSQEARSVMVPYDHATYIVLDWVSKKDLDLWLLPCVNSGAWEVEAAATKCQEGEVLSQGAIYWGCSHYTQQAASPGGPKASLETVIDNLDGSGPETLSLLHVPEGFYDVWVHSYDEVAFEGNERIEVCVEGEGACELRVWRARTGAGRGEGARIAARERRCPAVGGTRVCGARTCEKASLATHSPLLSCTHRSGAVVGRILVSVCPCLTRGCDLQVRLASGDGLAHLSHESVYLQAARQSSDAGPYWWHVGYVNRTRLGDTSHYLSSFVTLDMLGSPPITSGCRIPAAPPVFFMANASGGGVTLPSGISVTVGPGALGARRAGSGPVMVSVTQLAVPPLAPPAGAKFGAPLIYLEPSGTVFNAPGVNVTMALAEQLNVNDPTRPGVFRLSQGSWVEIPSGNELTRLDVDRPDAPRFITHTVSSEMP
jgi:hypothetical protein